ncbi:MAG: histidine kinase dimerization/phospho-acceptor domain-containing protein, partial [Pseudomonadota bacterium]
MDLTLSAPFRKFDTWRKTLGERSISTKIALLLTLAAILSCAATYAALNSAPPFGDNPTTVIWLLNLNLIILALLVGLIARRIVRIWSNRRQGIAGSGLHVRLVLIFSILTATPAIIMAVFSAFFFHFGVQTWFSDRVQTAVFNAQAVAEAYLEESQQSIRGDSLLLAQDITLNASVLIDNQQGFIEFLDKQSFLRNFSEVVVFDGTRRVIGTAGFTFALSFDNVIANLPESTLDLARNGEVVIMTGENEDRVRAIVRLANFQDTFIFVGRIIDPAVLANLENTRTATADYSELQGQFSGLQITVTMIFVVVALMLLLAAIWFGIVLARQMINPISTLIDTADQVRAGDLTARVPMNNQIEEFEFLAGSFNRMTSQIQEQRDELVKANRQMDERRRFTETVLAGVSSGIIGLNEKNKIRIANVFAHKMFEQDSDKLVGQDISALLPDIDELLTKAYQKAPKIVQNELPFITSSGAKRILLVRIAIERLGDVDKGAVITFDDITELQSAQRKAAWADVARRIAHEIKNPLTPIQLSAERLKRKYLKEVQTDPEIFEQCTDTIVKHVDDIGRMVSEFSSFARMPEPIMKNENVKQHILETLTLQQQAHPNILFTHEGLESENDISDIECDARQLRQALTNLTLNAIDSIESRKEQDTNLKGHIHIFLSKMDNDQSCIISISDNGIGFPE